MSMKAILVKESGSKEQLYHGESEKPQPKENEVLVQVKVFGLNRMDIVQREGKYPPPPGASTILGVEVSGIVVEVGSNVKTHKVGDRVCGLLPGGGYSEFAVISENLTFALPDAMTFEQAAAIPEVFFTAYQALNFVGKFSAGKSILIHAGASGVGSALIQLAKLSGASKIFVTAGSQEKIKYCKDLGADAGFNYKEVDFQNEVLSNTENKGVDLIIDFVGADYWNKNLGSLALDGKLVILGLLSGFKVADANIGLILKKRINVEGSTLRSRTVEYQGKLCTALKEFGLLNHILSGDIKVNIDQTFSWKDIKQAHEFMEASRNMGKIVVNVD